MLDVLYKVFFFCFNILIYILKLFTMYVSLCGLYFHFYNSHTQNEEKKDSLSLTQYVR